MLHCGCLPSWVGCLHRLGRSAPSIHRHSPCLLPRSTPIPSGARHCITCWLHHFVLKIPLSRPSFFLHLTPLTLPSNAPSCLSSPLRFYMSNIYIYIYSVGIPPLSVTPLPSLPFVRTSRSLGFLSVRRSGLSARAVFGLRSFNPLATFEDFGPRKVQCTSVPGLVVQTPV